MAPFSATDGVARGQWSEHSVHPDRFPAAIVVEIFDLDQLRRRLTPDEGVDDRGRNDIVMPADIVALDNRGRQNVADHHVVSCHIGFGRCQCGAG